MRFHGITGPIRSPRVTYHQNLTVPMRDGVVLRAHRWVPSQADSAPLLLVRTPYGRGTIGALVYGRILAHCGFQVLMQSCRGTVDSGGSFDRPFAAEREDGFDTVEWLREQPWYPGSYSTVGGSYFGYTQLALADAAPDEHAAAVLIVTPTTVREIAWPDGAFSPGMALRWAAQTAKDPASFASSLLRAKRLDAAVRTAAATPSLQDSYRGATGRRLAYFEQWLHDDPALSPWPELDLTEAIEQLKGPVLIQAGWHDVFLDSSLRQYRRLQERGVDVRLTLGPWTHGQVGLKATQDVIDFLSEVLLDGPARADGRVVRIFGAKHDPEQHLDQWPPTTTAVDFDLAPSGRAATCYLYDPADPTPQCGGALLDLSGGGSLDNRELEKRSDVVTFDTSPMTADVPIAGAAKVRLVFESDRPCTAVMIRICVASPDGSSRNLTDRMQVLAPNGTSRWSIEAQLPDISAKIPAGHRLRLQVSSGAFPRFLPHSGTDESQTKSRDRVPARQTIHHSQATPLTLTVPVVQGA